MKAQNYQSQGWYNRGHPEPAASAQANPPCSALSPQVSPAWAPQWEFLSELGVTSAHSNTPAAAQFGSGVIVSPDMLEHCSEVDCAFSHQHC